MNDFKTEIVSAVELAPGDLVERLGLAGLGWFVVAFVECIRVSGFPGTAVRVEFEGAPARRYLPGSTFRRRVEQDDTCPSCNGEGRVYPDHPNALDRECVQCAGMGYVVEVQA